MFTRQNLRNALDSIPRAKSEDLKEKILDELQNSRSIRSLVSDYKPHEMTIRGEIQKYQVVPDAGVETQAEEFRNLHSSLGHVSSDQYVARFW